MSAKPLFDDEGEEEVQLKVNEGFAKRFEASAACRGVEALFRAV